MECLGRTARRAAVFQEELCLTILRGFRAQLLADRRTRQGEHAVYISMMDGQDEVDTCATKSRSEPLSTSHVSRSTENVIFTHTHTHI